MSSRPYSLLTLLNSLEVRKINRTQVELDQDSSEEKQDFQPYFKSESQAEPLCIEIGMGLVPLVDTDHPHSLTLMIKEIRSSLAKDFGFLLPPVKLRDHLHLKSTEYRVCFYNQEITRVSLFMDKKLVISPTEPLANDFPGIHILEPSFHLPASWVDPSDITTEIEEQYIVVDARSVLHTHLVELFRNEMHTLFEYDALHPFLKKIAHHQPLLIHALEQSSFTLPLLIEVLKDLLKSKLALHEGARILHTCLYVYTPSILLEDLIDQVRQALSRSITHQYQDSQGIVHHLQLDSDVEAHILESHHTLHSHPQKHYQMMQTLAHQVMKLSDEWEGENEPILLIFSSPEVRRVIDGFFKVAQVFVPVLYVKEIESTIRLNVVAKIKLNQEDEGTSSS